jgi:hypothetical protein
VRALLDPDQGGFNEGERDSDLQNVLHEP